MGDERLIRIAVSNETILESLSKPFSLSHWGFWGKFGSIGNSLIWNYNSYYRNFGKELRL
jgi:hypothetical protein